MLGLSRIFTIYIDVLMIVIGVYMMFIQRRDLINIEELKKEAIILKVLGVFYIVLGIVGLGIYLF